MKTIKHERQVRLDELMKYVWDNNITRTRFEGKDCSIYVDDRGNFKVADEYSLCKSDLYTITEEVDIEYDTILDLIAVRKAGTVSRFENRSIQGVLAHVNIQFEVEEYQLKFIYLQNEDGSIGDLVWSKERGLNATNTEI